MGSRDLPFRMDEDEDELESLRNALSVEQMDVDEMVHTSKAESSSRLRKGRLDSDSDEGESSGVYLPVPSSPHRQRSVSPRSSPRRTPHRPDSQPDLDALMSSSRARSRSPRGKGKSVPRPPPTSVSDDEEEEGEQQQQQQQQQKGQGQGQGGEENGDKQHHGDGSGNGSGKEQQEGAGSSDQPAAPSSGSDAATAATATPAVDPAVPVKKKRGRPRKIRDPPEGGAPVEGHVAAATTPAAGKASTAAHSAAPAPVTFTSGGTSHDDAHQVFSTEFISAMHVDDAEILHNYLVIEDTWKQMYNDPIQVPAGSNVHEVKGKIVPITPAYQLATFTRPREYIRLMSGRGEAIYDLDNEDEVWLKTINEDVLPDTPIDQKTMERAMYMFEKEAFDGISCLAGMEKAAADDALCDVCQFPEGHEGNEMVFCDGCNVCVHQVCYGIVHIPEGPWYCNPCAANSIAAACSLCTTKGGALKPTERTGEWAHVSCALWIPEVRFKDETLAEPIILRGIPRDRYDLHCMLCRKREGACIQCKVGTCTASFHVACARQHKLRMDHDLDDAGEVVRNAYCAKHAKSGLTEEQVAERAAQHKEMMTPRPQLSPATTLKDSGGEFCDFVDVEKVGKELCAAEEQVRSLYGYWVLKRRRQRGQPLMRQFAPKAHGATRTATMHSNSRTILKSLKETRLSLDRARFLCDLVRRRENMKREVIRLMRSAFVSRAQEMARTQAMGLPELLSEEALWSTEEAAYLDADGQPSWPENPQATLGVLACPLVSDASEAEPAGEAAHSNSDGSTAAATSCGGAVGEDGSLSEGAGEEQEQEVRVKNMQRAVAVIQKHPSSGQFLFPVNTDMYPDYLETVSEPMDLATLESRVASGAYTTYRDFADDMNKIFSNCLEYNHPDSDIVRDAKKLAALFKQWEKKYVEGNLSLASPFKEPPSKRAHIAPAPSNGTGTNGSAMNGPLNGGSGGNSGSGVSLSDFARGPRAASAAAQSKIQKQSAARPYSKTR